MMAENFPNYRFILLILSSLIDILIGQSIGVTRTPIRSLGYSAYATDEQSKRNNQNTQFVSRSRQLQLDFEAKYGRNQFACYSCMSESYRDNWQHLSKYYQAPHDFTRRCGDGEAFTPVGMGTINCSSICVTLKEANIQGGVFLGYNVIRGCLDKLLRYGFNTSAVNVHRFKHFDLCRSLPRSQLFRASSKVDVPPLMGEVTMCACAGDKCNGAGGAPGARQPSVWTMTLGLALILVLRYCNTLDCLGGSS